MTDDLYAEYPEAACFASYEAVRRAGLINMADHERIAQATDLTIPQIVDIQARYEHLMEVHGEYIEYLADKGRIDSEDPFSPEALEKGRDLMEHVRIHALVKGIEIDEKLGVTCPLLRAAMVGAAAILSDGEDPQPVILVDDGHKWVTPIPVPPHDDEITKRSAYALSLIVATEFSDHIAIVQDSFVAHYPPDTEMDFDKIPMPSQNPEAGEAVIITHHLGEHSPIDDGEPGFTIWMGKYHRADDGQITMDQWEVVPNGEGWLVNMVGDILKITKDR